MQNVCPGMKGNKALAMESLEENRQQQDIFNYGQSLPVKQEVIDKFKPTTVKGSQFKQPLLEYSGACAGCGETPYAKLITQLFGDRMYIAKCDRMFLYLGQLFSFYTLHSEQRRQRSSVVKFLI